MIGLILRLSYLHLRFSYSLRSDTKSSSQHQIQIEIGHAEEGARSKSKHKYKGKNSSENHKVVDVCFARKGSEKRLLLSFLQGVVHNSILSVSPSSKGTSTPKDAQKISVISFRLSWSPVFPIVRPNPWYQTSCEEIKETSRIRPTNSSNTTLLTPEPKKWT